MPPPRRRLTGYRGGAPAVVLGRNTDRLVVVRGASARECVDQSVLFLFRFMSSRHPHRNRFRVVYEIRVFSPGRVSRSNPPRARIVQVHAVRRATGKDGIAAGRHVFQQNSVQRPAQGSQTKVRVVFLFRFSRRSVHSGQG